MSILSTLLLIILLLLFVSVSILAFFGKFQWIWAFGLVSLIVFCIFLNFVFTFSFSSFLINNIHFKNAFEGFSHNTITITTSLLSSSLSIVIVNIINKQRDINDSRRKTKREDYQYYEQDLNALSSFLLEWKVKLYFFNFTDNNIESKDIEKLAKGIAQYKIYSETDFLKPLFNSNNAAPKKTVTEGIYEKFSYLHKKCLRISYRAKEQANNDNYSEAIETIVNFHKEINYENKQDN